LNKLLFLILIALVITSLFVGVKDLSITDVFRMSEDEMLVFTISRIPRTIALVLVGAGISVCGFIMQQISQNKFVSPTTAGTLDAAKMGILFSLLIIPQYGMMSKMLFSLACTFLVSILFIFIVRKVRVKSPIFIPLIGIMLGNILTAISTFFAYKHNIIQNMQGWLMGDFSSILQGQYETLYFILPVVIITYIYANQFTLVAMGEQVSKSLGLPYQAIVTLGLFCISLTVSVTVVTVGAIPFLGLIVPNLVSMFKGDNLKKNLPTTALFGAVFLLICDVVGRLIIFPYEIPIGLTVGVIGGFVFFILILKKNK